MPRLRGVGSSAKQILGLYLQDQFMRERQREQEAAITERQQSSNMLDFIKSTLDDVQAGTFRPEAYSPQARSAIEQYFNPMEVTPPASQRIAKALVPLFGKGYEHLPDEGGFIQSLSGEGLRPEELRGPDGAYTPDVQNALAALESYRTKVKGFVPTTPLEFVGEDGVKQRQVVPVNEAASYGALPQERTPEVEGNRLLRIDLANKYSPQATEAQAKQTNTLNRQTMGSEAAKAGAISGAQANSQLPAQKNLFQFSQDMRQEDALELEGERQKNRMAVKLAELAPNNNSAYMLLERAKGLNAQLDDDGGFMGRMATGIGSFLGTNTVARDLDDLADGAGILFAAALGNKGQVSEADKMAGKAYWPMSHQPKELRDRKLLRAEQLITIGDRVQRELGPMAPPALKAQRVKQLFQEMERAAGLPVLVGDELYYADEALPAQAPEADFELDEQ